MPLALENIAALISWPGEELTEGQFLAELVERTGVRLLIDVANLHTNHVNLGEDPATALDELPVEAIAYVHVAGGVEKDGVWHDTHAHPVTGPVLDVLAELRSRVDPPGVLLERDDDFPPTAELAGELDMIRATLDGASGDAERPAPRVRPSAPTVASTPPDATRDRLAAAQTALLGALVAAWARPAGLRPGTPRRPEPRPGRQAGRGRRQGGARTAGDPRQRLPGRLPLVRRCPPDVRRIPARRAGLRRAAADRGASPPTPPPGGRLTHWWQDRAGAHPPRRTTRLVRAARAALIGR